MNMDISIFVEDAMSGRSKEEHDNTIKNIFPRMGRIRKTETFWPNWIK